MTRKHSRSDDSVASQAINGLISIFYHAQRMGNNNSGCNHLAAAAIRLYIGNGVTTIW